MGLQKGLFARLTGNAILAGLLLLMLPACVIGKTLSDAQVSEKIKKEANQVIIEEFLKYELRDVNKHVTRPLLGKHPSLVFFINQVDRGPLSSLFFLETWVHKLQDAQRNIDSLPYSISFSGEEKKKILGLRKVTDKIISYGIPLMKRDFYRVIVAAKELADERRKHPMELIPKTEFRDAIYRRAEPTAKRLDNQMGELSDGELKCMQLGWVLEQVTITRLWLTVNDNRLPKPNDYMAYRKKRSAYFADRLKQIYGQSGTK
jgi:hypothetical protein